MPVVFDARPRPAVNSGWWTLTGWSAQRTLRVLKVSLARPVTWIEQAQRDRVGRLWLELSELCITDWATVVSTGECPAEIEGEGRLVTGRFEHSPAEVLNLYVEGEQTPIGTTARHPFRSQDRQAFVSAVLNTTTLGREYSPLGSQMDKASPTDTIRRHQYVVEHWEEFIKPNWVYIPTTAPRETLHRLAPMFEHWEQQQVEPLADEAGRLLNTAHLEPSAVCSVIQELDVRVDFTCKARQAAKRRFWDVDKAAVRVGGHDQGCFSPATNPAHPAAASDVDSGFSNRPPLGCNPIGRSWDIIHLSAQDACRRTSRDDQGRVPDEAKNR